MNLDRRLEKMLKDPEKRVKLFLAYNLGLFLVNVAIIIGLAFLFLRVAGVF